MKNFKTYQIAVQFYHQTATLEVAGHLRDQLQRASSSIVLNLAEGAGRFSIGDKRRFYKIAFGSLRECQAIFEIANLTQGAEWDCLDRLAAHLYKLIQAKQ